MGSKSSSTPAPDPALTAAQIRSMDQQNAMYDRIVSNSEALMPLQKEQMQFGLDTAKTAYEQSQADREYALERRGLLTAQQDKMIADANNFDVDARTKEMRDQSFADLSSGFSSARAASMRAAERQGINPASGRYGAMSGADDISLAAARAGAASKVAQAAKAEGYALTDRAANALAGYPSMGLTTTTSGAGLGASGLSLANSGLSGLNSGYTTAGSLAGSIGSNATGMYGAQANYSSNMAANSGNAISDIGSLVGTGLKLYGAFGSDPRLKQNVEFVGTTPDGSINLYEFEYIGGDGTRYRGVMADEIQESHPDAVSTDARGYLTVNYTALGLEMTVVGKGQHNG